MAANDWFNAAFAGVPHGLVRAEHFNALVEALQTSFALLPSRDALLQDRVTAAIATGGPVHYQVVLDHPPDAYRDAITLNIRWPVANDPDPTLSVVGADGAPLGQKPIRQVDGTALSANHFAAHSRGELYYVTQGAGYWILGAGARGIQGPAGPPDGTFSLNSSSELIFTPTGGGSTNLGPAAMRWRGAYSASTTYSFLNIVGSGATKYLHVGTADTTGTAVTDTSVWQPLARDGYDAAVAWNFSTSTTMADPAAGDVRLNNAAPASVTRIAVDDTDADGNGVGGWVATFDDTGESATGHGTLFIRDVANDNLLIYRVTGLSDNSGWTRLDVTHLSGTARPADDARLAVWFVPTGQKGDDGTQAFQSLTSGTTVNWPAGTKPNATLLLGHNVGTLDVTGTVDGGVYRLEAKQDTTGGRTLAIPSGWKKVAAQSIASGPGDVTIITIANIKGTIYLAPFLKDPA